MIWLARLAGSLVAVAVACSHPPLQSGFFRAIILRMIALSEKMVPNIRLERMTYRLQGGCSTS